MTIQNIKLAYLLIPALIVLAWLYYKNKNMTSRKKAAFVLRCFVILLVILSLMGIQMNFSSEETATVFLLDRSKSVEKDLDNIIDFTKDALSLRGDTDFVGAISFADRAVIEKKLSQTSTLNALTNSISDKKTNIEAALDKANFLFNPDYKKRIVLISDLKENVGDIKRKLIYLKNSGVTVDVYPVKNEGFSEVEVQSINLPKNAKDGDRVQAEVKVKSNVNTNGEMYFYSRGELVSKTEVKIDKGINSYILSSDINGEGLIDYRVEIVPDEDTYVENNALSDFINVSDKVRVLLVEHGGSGKNFKNMFNDLSVDVVEDVSVPTSVETLISYDAFVLADISLTNLSEDFVNNVNFLVKNNGKGLFVSGGQNSFALGGYYNTALEEMLPVDMKVKDKKREENLALVLVIDKSGSMTSGKYGVSKIELAVEAAIRSTDILNERDYLGVMAFDDQYKWALKLSKLQNKDYAQERIATIRAGGGTSILPALEEAAAVLSENESDLKHIILLTDGQAENTGYGSVLNKINRDKISLSTVAVGEGADRRLLKMLAERGGGRYYNTDVFTDIPTIFAKEAVLAGKKYLNQVDFYPTVHGSYSKILEGINELPMLHGYTATVEKQLAKVLLSGPDESPILATYNYGLGKTVAFTADMDGLWSSDWLGWENNALIWRNVISEIVNRDIGASYQISSDYKNGKGKIRIEFSDVKEANYSAITGVLTSSAKDDISVELKLVEPGVYEASFEAEDSGVYIAKLKPREGNEEVSFAGAVKVPYSDEYRFLDDDVMTPEELVQISGGRVIESSEEIYSGSLIDVESDVDLSRVLMYLALIVFLFELLIRMTNIRLPKWLRIRFKKSGEDDDRGVKKVDKEGGEDKEIRLFKTKLNEDNKTKEKEEDDYYDMLLK